MLKDKTHQTSFKAIKRGKFNSLPPGRAALPYQLDGPNPPNSLRINFQLGQRSDARNFPLS